MANQPFGKLAVLEPLPEAELRALAGRSLVDAERVEGLPVRVLNPSVKDVVLRKGTAVCSFQKVEKIIGAHTGDPTPVLQGVEVHCVSPEATGYSLEGLPEPLQDLYRVSSTHLDKSQKIQLQKSLRKDVNTFTIIR